MSLNKWSGIGRLTADPRTGTYGGDKTWASFTVAVDRDFRNSEGERETDFIDISCFGKLGEVVANNLGKGRLVYVEGRLEIQTYEAEDGSTRRSPRIMANTVQFLDWPKDSDGGESGQGSQQVAATPGQVPF